MKEGRIGEAEKCLVTSFILQGVWVRRLPSDPCQWARVHLKAQPLALCATSPTQPHSPPTLHWAAPSVRRHVFPCFLGRSVHLSLHPLTHPLIHPSLHSPTHLYIHPFIHPSIQPFKYLSIHPSIIYSSIHPSVHPSIHPPIYSFVHLSIHPSTSSSPGNL